MSNFNLINDLNQSTTLQALSDQLKIHAKLQNFWNVGGINGQPFLRLADNVQQMLLTRRMPWKFNRRNLGSNNPAENPAFFVTQQGFQDFKFAGASCFTLINSTTPGGQLPAGGAGVDLNPGVYAANGNGSHSVWPLQWRKRIRPDRKLADRWNYLQSCNRAIHRAVFGPASVSARQYRVFGSFDRRRRESGVQQHVHIQSAFAD